MGKKHIVKSGDHLSKLAAKYGFVDYRVIWDHAANAALKAKRENPHVLNPGDEIIIPDKQEKTAPAAAKRTTTFELQNNQLLLRVRLKNFDNELLKPTDLCVLKTNRGVPSPLLPDNKGIIEEDIDPVLEKAELLAPFHPVKLDLRIGELPTVDTPQGQRARLNNLGYFAGFSDNEIEQFRWAVEEFKCDQGLKPVAEPLDPITGIKSPALRKKLHDVHGS